MTYSGCECWWADTTDLGRRRLRTYEDGTCPGRGGGYHDAQFDLDEAPLEHTEHGYRGDFDVPDDWVFPAKCDWCSHVFTPAAHRQGSVSRLYRRADTGALVELRGPTGYGGQGPAGMLFHCDWDPAGAWRDRYGDGINLMAVCPNHSLWNVDGPARNDGKVTTPEAWTRTGNPREPQSLSASPSIVAGDYHGFLTNGRFTDG